MRLFVLSLHVASVNVTVTPSALIVNQDVLERREAAVSKKQSIMYVNYFRGKTGNLKLNFTQYLKN